MKAHIVLHTHWDREWYFTTSDSLVLMDRTFKNIINELKENASLHFCLDGQYSIIEEFLSINPEVEVEVQRLVDLGQLDLGPWYTQTDTQLIDQESILKNLYYGTYMTKKRFGRVMKVAYLPDTFGFNNQIPEIVKQCEIDKIIFWRGSKYADKEYSPYFNWQSQSGSKALTINLVGGYGMAKGLNASKEFIDKTLIPIVEKFKGLGIENEILIPVGNDQFEILENAENIVKQINTNTDLNLEITDYETALNSISKGNLETYSGEFRQTEHTRLHKSIGSARTDIKKSNYIAEQYLLNVVEPLNVIFKEFNLNVSTNLIYNAWKLLFEGQAHDGICGCVSDDVCLDILNRNKRALEIAKSIENLILKQAAINIGITNQEILIVNTSMYKKNKHNVSVISKFKDIDIVGHPSETVNTTFIKGVKGALLETPNGNEYVDTQGYYIHEVLILKEMNELSFGIIEFKEGSIVEPKVSNEIIISGSKIIFEDGKLYFHNDGEVIEDFIFIENMGNDGDTYDFSPLRGDKVIKVKFDSCISKILPLYKELKLSCVAEIPYNLENRISKDRTNEVMFNLTIFDDGDDIFKMKLEFINNIYSHRIRVGFNTSLTDVKFTEASTAYGSAMRDITNGKTKDNWESNNVECPIDIETFDGFVSVKNSFKQFNFFSTYGKEYQFTNGVMYLTVLATTGQLGKEDLLYRPGRASGDVTKVGHVKISTPMAEQLGPISFEFGFSQHKNSTIENYRVLDLFRSKSVSYQIQDYNKFIKRIDNKIMPFGKCIRIPREHSFIDIKTNAILTNISIDLDNNVIIRGFTSENHHLEVSNANYCYVAALGTKTQEPSSKFEIFNIKLEE